MKLITRKSECIRADKNKLVKSPKEAIRKTLSKYMIMDGLIIDVLLPAYNSKEQFVLRDTKHSREFAIKLDNNNSLINIAN